MINIRAALADEAEKLTKIAFASKRYWQYPEAWIELWSDELTISKGYIQFNDVFCASVTNQVAGWYALCRSGHGLELDSFWVLPGAIGNGVGAAMMQHAKKLFSESQAETMTVISDPNAKGFYLKMGFEKVGMHPSKIEGRVLPVLTFSRSKV